MGDRAAANSRSTTAAIGPRRRPATARRRPSTSPAPTRRWTAACPRRSGSARATPHDGERPSQPRSRRSLPRSVASGRIHFRRASDPACTRKLLPVGPRNRKSSSATESSDDRWTPEDEPSSRPRNYSSFAFPNSNFLERTSPDDARALPVPVRGSDRDAALLFPVASRRSLVLRTAMPAR